MANPHPVPRFQLPSEPYQPRDAVGAGIKAAALGGTAGFFVSAVQNSLAKRNVGAAGVFTRTGGTIAVFTAVPTVYEFSKQASANLRQKDDWVNTTIGAFLGGSIIGMRSARIPQILGWGAAASVIMTAFDITGGSLRGNKQISPEFADEWERKEYLRKNRRRPMAETISELGEGRGIKPPGYEERRRERLKEKYGVEINPVKCTVDDAD